MFMLELQDDLDAPRLSIKLRIEILEDLGGVLMVLL